MAFPTFTKFVHFIETEVDRERLVHVDFSWWEPVRVTVFIRPVVRVRFIARTKRLLPVSRIPFSEPEETLLTYVRERTGVPYRQVRLFYSPFSG